MTTLCFSRWGCLTFCCLFALVPLYLLFMTYPLFLLFLLLLFFRPHLLLCAKAVLDCVYSCSRHLEIRVWKTQIVLHTCPDLFAPQWRCQLVAQFQFSRFKICYLSVLRCILLKLHILGRLIKSFPTPYGLCSCVEIKLLIPLEAQALRSSMERGSSAVIFQSYVLSCWKMLISAQVIESFPMAYGSWSSAEEKLSIPLEPQYVGSSGGNFLSFRARTFQSCNLLILRLIMVKLQI